MRLVLVVDDEPELCDLVGFQLRLDGFVPIMADGGHAAFEVFQREQPILVISDIRMPNGSGVELLEKIRSSDRPHTPVILMTGFSDTDQSKVRELGASTVLMKPFRLDALTDAVRNCLLTQPTP